MDSTFRFGVYLVESGVIPNAARGFFLKNWAYSLSGLTENPILQYFFFFFFKILEAFSLSRVLSVGIFSFSWTVKRLSFSCSGHKKLSLYILERTNQDKKYYKYIPKNRHTKEWYFLKLIFSVGWVVVIWWMERCLSSMQNLEIFYIIFLKNSLYTVYNSF